MDRGWTKEESALVVELLIAAHHMSGADFNEMLDNSEFMGQQISQELVELFRDCLQIKKMMKGLMMNFSISVSHPNYFIDEITPKQMATMKAAEDRRFEDFVRRKLTSV